LLVAWCGFACERFFVFPCFFFDASFATGFAAGVAACTAGVGAGAAGAGGATGAGATGAGATGAGAAGATGVACEVCQRHAAAAAPATMITTPAMPNSRRAPPGPFGAGCGGGGGASSDRAVLSDKIWLSVTPSVFSGANGFRLGRLPMPRV
jgi:hypothetical protein